MFPTLYQLLYGTIILYALSVLGLGFYNVYLHPLARFPGPKLRAAFYLPSFVEAFQKTSLKSTLRMHEQYGTVVRISPDSLSFASEQAWRDIYGFNQQRKQIPKDFKRFLVNPTVVNIMSANDTDHARIRKLLSHAFSESALREQEGLMNEHFSELLHQLHRRVQDPAVKGKVDLGKWYNLTAYDMITDLAYGEPFGFLQEGEYTTWLQSLFMAFRMLTLTQMGHEYFIVGLLLKLMTKIPSMQKRRRMMFHFSQSKTEKRLESATTRKDFMSYILRHNDERGMARSEIFPTAAVLVNAGGGTTSIALSAATYNILKNPHVLERVQKEVRCSFANESDISLATVSRLPYLRAVIKETLRIRPPTGGIFARRVQSSAGDVVDGMVVPSGTALGVHQYSINHSKKLFHHPEAFVPERWLPDAPAEYRNDIRDAAQPFSLGPRGCLGKNLAQFELESILARMLWAFDMEICEESRDWDHGQDFVIVGGYPPLMVQLRER